MSANNEFCVGDIIIKDTAQDAPQQSDSKKNQHHCVVVGGDFVFLLGKNIEYYQEHFEHLLMLHSADYPWLDQDRYVDCCNLKNMSAFEIRYDINCRLCDNDVKKLYYILVSINGLPEQEAVNKRIKISKKHITYLLASINDWSLDKYSKPITDI